MKHTPRTEAIRTNTPRELRNDFYTYLIDSTWPRFLGLITLAYLLINLVFAGLYCLQPGSLLHSRTGAAGFVDAYYFSAQTFATIGYGTLAPATDFANVIVVMEAAFGLACVAVITGLMFTKVAKPRPGILFSHPILMTSFNGKPHVMFRVGNTRGNEIVSAEISVSFISDEITAEGHRMRRMNDLALVRSKSPFFALSWSVLHEINESSPFYNVRTKAEIAKKLHSISCVLTGHDSTYGQTVYTRHVYLPEDFNIDTHFVDVVSLREDGRYVLDYSKFHHVSAPQPQRLKEMLGEA